MEGGKENKKDYFEPNDYNYSKLESSNDNTESRWANAITPDGSYWVWIPRFAYNVTYYTDASKETISQVETEYRDFDVIFLNETSNVYLNGYDELKPLPQGYQVASAFTGNTEDGGWSEELTGFWVSKYEISAQESEDSLVWTATNNILGGGDQLSTNAGNVDDNIRPVARPNVPTWRGISVGKAYTNIYNMYRNLNSHLVKNSEWEAPFILAESEYGRNGNFMEIDTNVNAGGAYSTSTTGNETGVFDLLGGVWEYTATYIPSTNNEALDGTNNNILEEYASYLVNSSDNASKEQITTTDLSNMILSDIEQAVFENAMLETPYETSLIVYRGGYINSANMDAESIPVAGSNDIRIGYRAALTCTK